MKKCDFGLIGLAVYSVAVFNRTVEKVDRFINDRAQAKHIVGCRSIEELVQNLERPRKAMLLVKAGPAVDAIIDMLIPHMEEGDIIIDGGNTYFEDTIRRTKYVEEKGLLYIGTGVSGGEEGALRGPSIMPGGSPGAWEHVKPIFQAIAA
jgi:6-phosphogluconate dehydrogenase